MFSSFKTFVNEKIKTIKAEYDTPKPPSSPIPPTEQQTPEPESSISPIPIKAKEQPTSDGSSWKPLDSLIKTIDPSDGDIPLALWKTNIASNAGQPLIRRYENIWTMCHENNIDLGRAAERADRTLRSAISTANKHHKQLLDLEKALDMLPTFLDRLGSVVNQVNSLKRRMETLENAFEGVAREQASNTCKNFRKQLATSVLDYQKQKEKELHQVEYKLRVEKQRADRDEQIQQNLKRLEEARAEMEEKRRKQKEEREKQRAIKEAVAADIAEFQSGEKGKIPKTTLEAFDLEVDESELMDFLADEGENAPVGVDPSLVYPTETDSDNVEILPVIENPDEEYHKLKQQEIENITSNEELRVADADESVSSLLNIDVKLASPTQEEDD